ncbi:MAG TPA: hypothetical protein VLA72_03505 [Anaerolineales bacterium]|nr:hypothetical protein [Anaerolineales bacterium]
MTKEAELLANHEIMLKEIRSWGLWSLGLGVVHLISSGFLNSSWGILLIIVGLSSFYYRTAPMFIMYTVTLSWAALSNLLSFNTEWVIFSVLQGYFAFRTLQDFRRFRNTEDELKLITKGVSNNIQRVAKSFPWIGAILSCLSVFTCIASILIVFFVIDETLVESFSYPPYLSLMFGLIETFSVLGFSVSLISLISKYKPKILPIIGIVISGLFMVLEIISRFSI